MWTQEHTNWRGSSRRATNQSSDVGYIEPLMHASMRVELRFRLIQVFQDGACYGSHIHAENRQVLVLAGRRTAEQCAGLENAGTPLHVRRPVTEFECATSVAAFLEFVQGPAFVPNICVVILPANTCTYELFRKPSLPRCATCILLVV